MNKITRQIIETKDGSHTIHIPEMNVTYHSVHGSIQESLHVFIQEGLLAARLFDYVGVHEILEIGFGTGLNALLTLLEADKRKNRIYYTSLELFPLTQAEAKQLNYCQQLHKPDYQKHFDRMHEVAWNEMFEITEYFRLTKIKESLLNFTTDKKFSVVYFDAFAPSAQPELWTTEVFEKIYQLMNPEGVFVTYCSKGDVRRALIAAGFKVEKVPGPPGKREMLRAVKGS